MVKVNKLSPKSTLSDVKIGNVYFGKVVSGRLFVSSGLKIVLNEARYMGKPFVDGRLIPFKVKKLSFPNLVDAEVINEPVEFPMRTLISISNRDVGKSLTIDVIVEDIIQTSGPTVFKVTDGTVSFKLTSFDGAGKRALPDILVGDAISFTFEVNDRRGSFEGEIKKYVVLSDSIKSKVVERVDSVLHEKCSVSDSIGFSIKSDILDKLKPDFKRVAFEIRKAIFSGRPIYLRHHVDTDGYSAGYALSKAILPLVIDQCGGDLNTALKYFYRLPNKPPFYDYLDATKDVVYFTDNMRKFGDKAPLIIHVDNGSTPEDILGARKVCMFGADYIAVDHHYPGEVDSDGKLPIEKYSLALINPYKVGGDSNVCAGMLCAELAKFINPDVDDVLWVASLSGRADHCEGNEYEQYVAKSLYGEEFEKKLSAVIEYEASILKFMTANSIFDVLFGSDKEKQRLLVDLIYPYVSEKIESAIVAAKKYSSYSVLGELKSGMGSLALNMIDVSKTTSRGGYPAAGKMTAISHDVCIDSFEGKVITLGYGPDFMVFRVDGVEGFDVNELVSLLKKNVPASCSDGGGHAFAGSLKFLESSFDEVLSFVKSYIQNLVK